MKDDSFGNMRSAKVRSGHKGEILLCHKREILWPLL